MVATRAPRTIDLAGLIDGRKLTPFNYVLIALSTLITLFDGLDMMMVSFTAPYMRDELGLTTTQFGNVFSAGTVGMVLGGLGFTYVGDRIGRRPTIVFCAPRLRRPHHSSPALRPSYPALLSLRFLDGLAIGGMLPLAWALNIEFVPERMRATVDRLHHDGFQLRQRFRRPADQLARAGLWLGRRLFRRRRRHAGLRRPHCHLAARIAAFPRHQGAQSRV